MDQTTTFYYGASDQVSLTLSNTATAPTGYQYSGYTASNLSKAEGNEGTWTTGGNDGVWEGNAQKVAFNVNSQVRFTTIIVTLAGSEEPTFLRGDVNNSQDVTIADVSALIDYLLSGDSSAINLDAADCNNSQDVTIADVSALIDYLLSGNWPN